MTAAQLYQRLGISAVRQVSANTTVIEFPAGGARPATAVEQRLLALLLPQAFTK